MGPDEALIVGEVPDPDHLHLPRDTGMTDLDAVGVADKGRGHGLEVPEVAAPGEAQDISPCLKGVDHGLLGLFAPVKDTAGKEVMDLDAPGGRHGIQRLYAALLSDGETLRCV